MRLAPMTILLLAAFSTAAMPKSDRNDLAAQLAGRTAGPPQDCVPIEPASNLRPVDAQTLVVERGATLYVNRLRGGCPGLDPTDTIIFVAHGSQYCRGDHFRTRPFGGGVVPGPICILGDFVPYRRAR
ncbi:MAG TPA: DUF6491 family protein [Allosphingosinicella sp.]|nr:DUF6491 family protein [Allosphingosinicella sp.]